jgi:hypothetical protein
MPRFTANVRATIPNDRTAEVTVEAEDLSAAKDEIHRMYKEDEIEFDDPRAAYDEAVLSIESITEITEAPQDDRP